MLLLTSTSDIVRLVTGAAGDIDVHTSYVDNASGTITPARTNTPAITTATTTTIVASPGASTQRNVKHINIENASATVSNTVTVQHFDGTTSTDLCSVTLLSGENLIFTSEGEWTHHDSNGGVYPATITIDPWNVYGATGTVAETIPRSIGGTNVAALTSGTLLLMAVYLRAGQRVANISFCSGTTAAGTPTNQFFALYDINRNLLAQSANATTAAWAANTIKTLAMTASYTATTTGLYYVGVMVSATTVPSLAGLAANNAAFHAAAPILVGNSTTGLTTTLPNPAAAITAGANKVWAGIT